MKNKDVALVLSSGGARGIAHIGVIQELESRGYTITSVSGASIGAVIGGFYAAGKLQEYTDWICTLGLYNVFNLIDFSFSTKGVIKGERVFSKLREWMDGLTFDELEIPFSCVAADLKNRKEVILDSGDVLQSMRASIAIPGYFEPLLMDDVYLYDGGIINPIPVNRVHRKAGDIVVAVDLNAHEPSFDPKAYWKHGEPEEPSTFKVVSDVWFSAVEKFQDSMSFDTKKAEHVGHDKEKPLGRIEALTEMFELMQENVTQKNLEAHKPDVLIRIPRSICSTFEFHRSQELIAFGREQAALVLDKLEGVNTLLK